MKLINIFLLIATLAFSTSSFAELSKQQAKERLAKIDKEMEEINKQIKSGVNPDFFTKFIKKFEDEKKELQAIVGSSKVKKAKKLPKKKTIKAAKRQKTQKAETLDQRLARYENIQKQITSKKMKLQKLKESQLGWANVKDQYVALQNSLIALQRESDKLSEKLGPMRVLANSPGNYDRGMASSSLPLTQGKLKFSGHLKLRLENKNTTGYVTGKEGYSSFRLRGNFLYQVNNKTEIGFTPQATKNLGANDPDGKVTSGSAKGYHTPVDFYEAYVKHKFTDNFSLQTGRQALAYGDQLIVGSLGWATEARSFDAIRGSLGHGNGKTDFFLSQITDSGTEETHSDDTLFYGVYSELGGLGFAKDFDLYYFGQNDKTVGGIESTTFGTRLKGTLGSVYYGLEAGTQSGAGVGDEAYQVDFETGYKGDTWKAGVGYAHAGKSYLQLYPTAHKFLGFADMFGRRNIKSARLHLSQKLGKNFKYRLDLHSFQRVDDTVTPYKLTGSAYNNTGNSTSSDLGSELDLVLTYKFLEKSKIELGSAFFKPGQYFKDQGASNSYSEDFKFIYLQLKTKF